MIGWEYPPHNSGGLGVACEGLTQALSQSNTQIYFSLPYVHSGLISHMNVLSCVDPSWDVVGIDGKQIPPFQAYTGALPESKSLVDAIKKFNIDTLRALPQSELENKVHQYADSVGSQGKRLQHNYDLIHAHDWMSYPAAMKLKQETGKAYIAHIHSTEFDRIPSGYGSNYIMRTEYEGMQAADRVIAVSNYTKRILIEKYSINPHKIDVVHNGISAPTVAPDPGTHHFAHRRPVIVFMGRLTMQKGADYFIYLARKVLKEIPDALFVVAGSGDMYHELLIKNAYNGLSASVVFSGFVRDNQREKLLDRADVFVMPSLSEPFGLVALEAAQRHTPVIISKTAGVSEVMSGSIVVDFWDIDAMTRNITQILADKNHSQTIVNNQLQNLQETTWEKAAHKVRSVYDMTLRG